MCESFKTLLTHEGIEWTIFDTEGPEEFHNSCARTVEDEAVNTKYTYNMINVLSPTKYTLFKKPV
jgi:hypothetical protein